MANETNGEPQEVLRLKYAELTRKYGELVERLNRKANQDLAIYRLGTFGLRVASAGLALVANGEIQISNERFNELARGVTGELSPLPPQEGPGFVDLRELVRAHARVMLEKRVAILDSLYKDEGSDATLALRLERSLRSGQWVVTVTAENVTDRTRRDEELARTREALFKRERLRVLGELAASIAHDLGNTLRGASFQLASLRQDAGDGAQTAAALEAVALRVEIASAAVARLHEFARKGTLTTSAVRVDHIVAEAAALVEIDFRTSAAPVEVSVQLPELPPVPASASELSLLFINLLRNARDAMPEGGTVSISGRRTRRGLLINVADQGTGLTAAVQKKLFEPFFTTKGEQGTGLGLWLAAGTMQRLGGTIEATNRPGRGATFVLCFPMEGAIQLPASQRRPGGGHREPSGPAPRRLGRVRRSVKRS